MSENRNSQDSNSQDAFTEEWPEKMRISQARKFLGVSPMKMTQLVSSGRLKYEIDPLDNRVKLVRRADLEALKRERSNTS